MKKNLFYLSMLAVALLAGSCSSDLDEGQTPGVNSGGQVITFEPWANKTLRAGATQAADMRDFAVLATDTSATDVLIDGALVTGSNATSWTYNPPAFWPESDTVNFFAFAPTAIVGLTGGAAALVGQNDLNAGEPTIEYELPALLSDQVDLLVARHSGTYTQDGTSGVRLNFRHALSRVLFQAKSESATNFEVLSIKLINLKSKATLDLNKVPKDTRAFPYPTDNATIASPGYQTFWEHDGTSFIDTLKANLTTTDVPGDGGWHYIVGNDDALYVIPQENAASSMDSATVVDGSPISGFYIEIAYQEKPIAGQPAPAPKTYAVPVPAIVGDAYASSIAFEMERQYTFQFELSGRKTVEFKNVTVSNYSNVTQEEPLRPQWAGSNIYWDGSKLTFADSGDKSIEQYQGVFFKWGSLVGMSPAGGSGSGWPGRTYFPTNPGVDDTWTTDATTYSSYAKIPYAMAPLAAPYNRDYAYLTEITNDSISILKGDICVYLTKIGAAPKGKRWRMPTSAEFKADANYSKVGAFSGTPGNASGTTTITGGYQRADSNHPYFPASGARNTVGTLDVTGTLAGYWSSSPASDVNGYRMYFNSTTVDPANTYARWAGFVVRCIVE